jgi:hypothetical protein
LCLPQILSEGYAARGRKRQKNLVIFLSAKISHGGPGV